jgi:peptide/nickel transport system ATP-binding protein
MAVLDVRDLRVTIARPGGDVAAVDGVSFQVERGRVLGLVGESGCGKSLTALALLQLLPPIARLQGSVRLNGRELVGLPDAALRPLRGAELAMIFQEPMTALNPVMTVGAQVAEAVTAHRPLGRRAAWAHAVDLLARVGIAEPARRARDYPHQLSGGMRQRVMIAMAIACEPKVLIADEPTTALDVTIQAGILELLRELRTEHGMALVLITHDLGVVAEQADNVAIMYGGRIVEQAPSTALFADPRHPYTAALLRSMPTLGRGSDRLLAIPGNVPALGQLPSGCGFRDRCAQATVECGYAPPPLRALPDGHAVACVHA